MSSPAALSTRLLFAKANRFFCQLTRPIRRSACPIQSVGYDAYSSSQTHCWRLAGLVIERQRSTAELDGLRWYCRACSSMLVEQQFHCSDLGTQLKPLING